MCSLYSRPCKRVHPLLIKPITGESVQQWCILWQPAMIGWPELKGGGAVMMEKATAACGIMSSVSVLLSLPEGERKVLLSRFNQCGSVGQVGHQPIRRFDFPALRSARPSILEDTEPQTAPHGGTAGVLMCVCVCVCACESVWMLTCVVKALWLAERLE